MNRIGNGMLAGLALLAGCSGGDSDVERILNVVTGTPSHQAVAIGDLNSDGLQDVASLSHVLDTNVATLNVFVRQPDGRFQDKIEIPLGRDETRRLFDLAIEDVNLDGMPDAVVTHVGLTTAGVTPGRQVSVLIKNGAGASDFGPFRSYDVADNPFRLAIGDLDLDGLPDLVVATRGGTYTLFQDAGNPGAYQAARQIDDGSAMAVAVADLTGDGLPDVLTAGSFGLRLLSNDVAAVGTFSVGGAWSTPTEPWDMTLGDFDGDGQLDVAVALSRSDHFDHAGIAYRLQDPLAAGEFGPETEIVFPDVDSLGSIDALDLDDDGLADLITAVLDGPDGISLAVQISTAAGFGSPVFYDSPQSLGPRMATAGQLGPDDLPDAVLAYGLDGVFVHQGEFGGTFSPAGKIGE